MGQRVSDPPPPSPPLPPVSLHGRIPWPIDWHPHITMSLWLDPETRQSRNTSIHVEATAPSKLVTPRKKTRAKCAIAQTQLVRPARELDGFFPDLLFPNEPGGGVGGGMGPWEYPRPWVCGLRLEPLSPRRCPATVILRVAQRGIGKRSISHRTPLHPHITMPRRFTSDTRSWPYRSRPPPGGRSSLPSSLSPSVRDAPSRVAVGGLAGRV